MWRLVKLTRVSPRTLRSEQANADGQSVMQLAASHLEHPVGISHGIHLPFWMVVVFVGQAHQYLKIVHGRSLC